MTKHIPLVEFKNTNKRYDNHTAANELNLIIYQGEFSMLVGGSGGGKSTTLCMINALTEPADGDVYFNGRHIKDYDIRELQRRIGYVLRQTALSPIMIVQQNVKLMPDIPGWDKSKRTSRMNELLELVGIPPETYLNRYPRELSGGEQQRINILRAIAVKPDILLMDEPFSVLDPLACASFQEMVSLTHKKLGTTVVFVIHGVNEAARLVCRTGVMHQGRPVQVDTPQDIQNHPTDDYVRSLFGTAQPEDTTSADEVINPYRRLNTDGEARVREY